MNCHVHTSHELNTKEQEAGVVVQSFVETVNASVGCKPVVGVVLCLNRIHGGH